MKEENRELVSRDLIIDWGKFKSNAKGKQLNIAKNSYIEFCKMLDEVDFKLVSDYVGSQEKIELFYKLSDNIKLNKTPDSFKRQTYKRIIGFKSELKKNNDEFIKFIGLTNGNSLVAQVKTFDGGLINIDITNYNQWNKGRQDFYNKLKEVDGYLDGFYKGKDSKLNIYIDYVKLNPISASAFKQNSYKSIVNFKKELEKNSDKFIKFISLTNKGSLVVQIKSFDGGVVDIDMSQYNSFNKSRQDFYSKLKEVNGYTKDYYKGKDVKMNLYIDDVKLNQICSNVFKTCTYKAMVSFKKQLSKNNDMFIKFIGLTNGGNLIAKIKTFDGGIIEMDISQYNSWNKSRGDFYNKLKEINGYTEEFYKGADIKINIFIDDVKLNPMSPVVFKRAYKNIINFKNNLKQNNDKFIKFVGLTTGGNLITKIKTFDEGEFRIDIANYFQWNRARQGAYDFCKKKGYKILSPYINNKEKILVNFNCRHKPHWITPSDLKADYACPVCSESKGEKSVRLYLENKNIEFIQEYRFEECRCERSLPFDFYIPDYNLCIEFDGEQHYKVNSFFGEESFKGTQKRDKIKNNYCEDNGINLLRIPYWELENIEKILDDEFSKLREEFQKAC